MKTFLTTLIALITMNTFAIKAQGDLQINLSNLIFYEFNMNLEFKEVIDQGTIGIFGGYVYGFPETESDSYLNIGTEFRYYVSPNRGANGFYVGLYTRYKYGNQVLEISESGYDSSTDMWLYNYTNQEMPFHKVSVGLNFGMKWVTPNNLIFGFHIAPGRNIYSNNGDVSQIQNSIKDDVDPDTYSVDAYDYSEFDEYWDFRTGFNIGYRFGSTPIFREVKSQSPE
ncbi:MAG: hypothetical protein OCD76_14685 [Reichenbachiella sp.]